MSAEAQPISPARFAEAIRDLPVENIYSKAYEIRNSVSHLQRSNAHLQQYSDSIKNDASIDHLTRSEGDKDCLDAIKENDLVIQRQLERINLLKAEVERRGGRWHEEEPAAEVATNGTSHDEADHPTSASEPSSTLNRPPRLTDEELRRRLEEQLRDNDDDDGLHL